MYPRVWFLSIILIKYCETSSEAHYECGPHGRFEYCIDGIPGCVVGCHCHPGYYFDTESKICEPNSKLTLDYRRHYMAEPTRVPIINYEPASVSTPTPTPANPIDAKVDAIAQDTDDIGDWLYNQFFKTIENQVINKTDKEPLTRRSGVPAQLVPKRRSRKKIKKRSRRKKIGKRYRKKGLRRKLLRITEDDSLFDSSSKEYSSSSSSSSESDSSSMSDSKEHGHRKIVMINKKSTSPLPSFIFLPNIETPFYPPVGLAPPPIMPMYPMVPVPPMIPYPPPSPDCNNENNKTTSAPDHQNTTEAPTTATTEEATTTAAPTEAPTSEPPPPPGLRSRGHKNLALRKHGQLNQLMRLRNKFKKNNKKHYMDQFADNYQDSETPYLEDPDPPGPAPPNNMHPYPDMFDNSPPLENVDFKYLSQLIHKMDSNKSKPNFPFKPNRSMPNFDLPINPELPRRRNYQTPSQSIQMQNLMSPDNRQMQDAMLPQKYQMQPSLPTESYQMQNYQVQDLVRPHNRQINNLQASQNIARPASKADEYNNSFYSDLGKEIASLIRKVDGDREINIQIERLKSPMQTMFNENSNSPHSYWERFARSPLRRKPSYVENTKSLKRSSEVLNHLEDQVSLATTVERTLSLHELENIANIMNRAQSKPIKLKLKKPFKNQPTMELSKRNDFNLWPLLGKKSNAKKQVQINNNNIKNIDSQKNLQINVVDKQNNIKYKVYSVKPNNANQKSIIMRRKFDTKPISINPIIVHQNNNIQKTPQKDVFAIQPTRINFYNNNYNKKISDLQKNVAKNIFEIQGEKIYPQHVVVTARTYGDFNATKPNRNVSMNTISEDFLRKLLQSPKTTLHHQVSRIVRGNMTVPAEHIQRYKPNNPLMLNYKSFKFVTNNHNQYHPQHTLVPLPTVIRQVYKPSHAGIKAKTSYFHHEFQHFDYFE